MVTLVGGTLWLTALQNRAEGIKERERVKASFLGRVEANEATTKVFAVWDEAAERLVNRLDLAWADVNEGAYVYDQNGIEGAFVVEQSGKVRWGYVDGRRSRADPVALLGKGFGLAIRQMLSARPVSDQPLSGVSISRHGAAIFTIARIRPHGPTVRVTRGVNRYLVLAKLIDSRVIHDISRGANGAPLAFSERPRTGFSNWTFAPFDGGGSRSLVWVSAQPGSRLLHLALPWLLALIGLMTTLAALVLDRARKAARQLVASETKALYLASRDPLTGLPNRRSFSAHLLELRRRGDRHSVMFLDLDGFKKINDTFGHSVGDILLCRTAERLQRVLPPSAFLARLGGDEFAISFPKPELATDLDILAAQLIEAVNEPHLFGGEPTTIGISIGIAANERGEYDEIVRHADIAMYAAKQCGRDRWQHYSPSLEAGREERRRLERHLRKALANGEIFVVFQPIVDAQTGRTSTVEALARWAHPTMGWIAPDLFIPIAEESGLIVELGKQILEQACAAARDWPFRLAVNLSPAQFFVHDLATEVIATLARCDFPPTRFELEITETYLLSRPDAADEVIKGLRRHGIRIALDDFGTGYASIGYLRRFEFDLVKIDRSLVEAIAIDPAAADVLLAIVSLCEALGLPIIAEGVETAEQATVLRNSGCKYLQGWHFGRPVRAAQIDAMIAGAELRVA